MSSPSSACNRPPRIGNGLNGYASCQRITIIRQKPKNRNISAVKPYWQPMTLWSVEKMYLRQKGCSWCPWSSCAACVLIYAYRPCNLDLTRVQVHGKDCT